MRFQFSIYHVPGKSLIVADMLSRAPLSGVTDSDRTLQEDADAFVNLTLQSLPATKHRLEDIKQQQQQDDACRLLTRYCQLGWPSKKKLPDIVKPYSSVAAELSVQNCLLLRGCCIVVPTAMKQEKLYTGQLGIVKCRERARQSVWWPGLSTQLVQLIKNCRECCKERCQPAEPLITSELPELPFQKIGTDLFEWEKRTYLLVVDYYSRYIEIALLKRATSSEVITHLKSIFARHGIPELIVSDNGPHYSSEEFSKFVQEYQC